VSASIQPPRSPTRGSAPAAARTGAGASGPLAPAEHAPAATVRESANTVRFLGLIVATSPGRTSCRLEGRTGRGGDDAPPLRTLTLPASPASAGSPPAGPRPRPSPGGRPPGPAPHPARRT